MNLASDCSGSDRGLAGLTHVGLWIPGPFLGLGIAGLGTALGVLFFLERYRRQHRPSPAREPTGRSFAALMARHGFDPAIALVTYCYLHEMGGRRSAILPGARLRQDFGLSAEETEYTLLALMALLGRKPELGGQPQEIGTVEDLIGVLQSAPADRSTLAA